MTEPRRELPTMRPSLRAWATLAALAVGAVGSAGCDRLDTLWNNAVTDDAASDADTLTSADAEPDLRPRADDDAGGSAVEPDPNEPTDEDASVDGDASVESDAAVSDAGGGAVIVSLGYRAGIVEAPQRGARWIGYVRAGGRIAAVRGPVGFDGCPERRNTPGSGWWEVQGGGFVCVGPLAAMQEQVVGRPVERRLPVPPDQSQAMPFTYAINYRPVAVYRWLPSTEDEREVEPERFAPREPEAPPPVPLFAATDGGLAPVAATDAGTRRALLANADAAVPTDGPPRIEDLEGASGTPLLRRMLRGMYVSLDREVRASSGSTYWHTQAGGYVRSGSVSTLRSAPTFQGVVLDEQHHLPMGFMISTASATYQPNGRNGMALVARVPRLTVYSLTDEPPVTVAGEQYFHTTEGYFVRSRHVRVVTRHEPPADLAPGEKWIDVNLDHQSVVAYEGANPVYVTVASTGRRNRSNPDENYETIQGGFRIAAKHVATTMDGNSANDGPYSIEDVPWVMYFEGSFALHGAFWHNGFGIMRSHGCVNLAPSDARWFFNWTEPQLPEGWHGAYSTPQRPGTRVYVHYDNQPLGTSGGPERVPQH
ncbi:MAG: L,D-transpeptidase [Polyangiales bacterium]